jgi:hypothetical protein
VKKQSLTKFALLLLAATSAAMTIPGCPNNSAELTDLQTQVKSLNADLTMLKEATKQLTLVVQQQGLTIQSLQAKPAAASKGKAAPAKKKKKKGH